MSAPAELQMQFVVQREAFVLDVDLDLPLRGITGVFGPSGAGKTTLLRCIAGLERGAGKLVVADEVWQDSLSNTWRRIEDRKVGYVFQEPRLFDHLSVAGNIEYGRKRRQGDADVARIVELLGLDALLERRPSDLSGGEAQRAAIARALASAPQILLMDEPLASLDQRRKDEILPYLDRLHAESAVPILYVSHNIDEVCRLCDYLVVLETGKVASDGPLQSVLVDLESATLGSEQAGSIIEGTVSKRDDSDALSQLEFSGGSLWVPGIEHELGASMRLRIRASDVSLCRERPEATTILNVLPAIVESVSPAGGSSALIKLRLGDERILASVTLRSIRELGIAAGDQLFAQIKSVAVRPPI